MKESEAKNKWCPMVRFTHPPVPHGDGLERWNNRDSRIGFGESEASCIGSECMAWREDKELNAVAHGAMENEDHGYCGLAGKP